MNGENTSRESLLRFYAALLDYADARIQAAEEFKRRLERQYKEL